MTPASQMASSAGMAALHPSSASPCRRVAPLEVPMILSSSPDVNGANGLRASEVLRDADLGARLDELGGNKHLVLSHLEGRGT